MGMRHDFNAIAEQYDINPEMIVYYETGDDHDVIAVRSEWIANAIAWDVRINERASKSGKPLGDVKYYQEDDEVFMWKVTC